MPKQQKVNHKNPAKFHCRYCNKPFEELAALMRHICNKKEKGPKWNNSIGRNSKYAEKKIWRMMPEGYQTLL